MEAKNENNTDNDAHDLVPDDLKERYREFRLVGSGGMGRVISAHDTRLDKRVAIKVLPRAWLDTKAIMRFQQEAKAASKLKHAGVVQVMDFGYASSGEPFLVMEYVVGEDLESIVQRNGPIPINQVIQIAIQVSSALEHAHAQGVIHRDLKPANIMIDDKGVVRILDFGLARILHSDERLTSPGQAVGTLLYMSPEQLRGEESGVSVDIYALGLVIIKLLTGEAPHENANGVLAIVNSRLNEAPPMLPLIDDPSETYIALDEVVENALHLLPDDRFSDMSEFKKMLIEIELEPVSDLEQSGSLELLVIDQPEAKKTPLKWLIIPTAALITVVAISIFVSMKNNEKVVVKKPVVPVLVKPKKAAANLRVPKGFHPDKEDGTLLVAEESVGDKDLVRLQDSGVHRLSFQTNHNITVKGLKTLRNLELISLNLRDTLIGDESVDELNEIMEITTLNSLDLNNTNLTERGLRRLRPNNHMTYFSFKYLKGLTDNTLDRIIKSFPNIKSLNISGSSVTAKGIKHLKKLANLKSLTVEDLPIDDNVMDDIIDLKCSTLNLCGTRITDKTLAKLEKHPELGTISFEDCVKLTDAGIARLQKALPKLDIRQVRAPKPADEGLKFYEEFGIE